MAARCSPIAGPKAANACPPKVLKNLRESVPGLKRRREFLLVARTRKKWVAPGLIVQVRRHGEDEKPPVQGAPMPALRVGFTVSRKVGNAVVRNRVRRRLRAAVERVFPAHAKEGRDFVVIGRAKGFKRPFDALLKDLTVALKRLDAYKNPENPVGTKMGEAAELEKGKGCEAK